MILDSTCCKTWQDVLTEKGFYHSASKALIGFISWNKVGEFSKLGAEIAEKIFETIMSYEQNNVYNSIH